MAEGAPRETEGRQQESNADDVERRNVSRICRHLALLAIDGATEELALILDPAFRLHLDDVDADRWGYLALVEAERALWSTRPPLDVGLATARTDYVTVRLEPLCVAHFHLVDEVITDLWMTRDWNIWCDWLARYDMA